MRKTIQIILICLTIVAFGMAAELLPALVNQLDERHTTGKVVQVSDESDLTSSHLTLSYEDRLEILSSSPTYTVVFHTKKLSNVLDYDEAFLTNLQQQLALLEQDNLMSSAPSLADLTNAFVSADYVSVHSFISDDNSCFYNWLLRFEAPSGSSSSFTKLELLFDPEQKLLYQLNIEGVNTDKILANQKEIVKQLAKYYSCKAANASSLYSNQDAAKIYSKYKKSGRQLTANSASIYSNESADISLILTSDKSKIHSSYLIQTGKGKKNGIVYFYLGDFVDSSITTPNLYDANMTANHSVSSSN